MINKQNIIPSASSITLVPNSYFSFLFCNLQVINNYKYLIIKKGKGMVSKEIWEILSKQVLFIQTNCTAAMRSFDECIFLVHFVCFIIISVRKINIQFESCDSIGDIVIRKYAICTNPIKEANVTKFNIDCKLRKFIIIPTIIDLICDKLVINNLVINNNE